MAALRCRQGFGLYSLLCGVVMAALAGIVPAHAQVGSARYSSIVVDAAGGQVLEQANPDALRHPASLTKLMTLYLVFEALRDRRISLHELVPVSAHAAAQEPTKLGLVPGTKITVEEAILGLVTKSANDAAAALGELLGGSEGRFAQMMTLRARAMGMTRTTFTNASGLPDPDQWTTARDLALLGRRLVTDFPNDYHYFSVRSFVFQRRTIFGHDTMLRAYPGVDGMKTGYTDASGHNLETSALRDGVRLIAVEMGAASNAERDAHMTALLNQGFTEMGVQTGGRVQVAGRGPALVSAAHAATPAETRPTASHVAVGNAWGIQVGSYSSDKTAHKVGDDARRAAGGGELRIEHTSVRGTLLWRTQVLGLSEARAQGACAALGHRRTPCLVLRPDARLLASR